MAFVPGSDFPRSRVIWMSRWKLGSMDRKWVVSPTYKWGFCWGYYPLTNHLPNFLGHPSRITNYLDVWLGGSDFFKIRDRVCWLISYLQKRDVFTTYTYIGVITQ